MRPAGGSVGGELLTGLSSDRVRVRFALRVAAHCEHRVSWGKVWQRERLTKIGRREGTRGRVASFRSSRLLWPSSLRRDGSGLENEAPSY